jgi:hypothetical protein
VKTLSVACDFPTFSFTVVENQLSSLQQICPSCQRRLELPSESIGRMARCPACQHVFTVASAGPSETAASPVVNQQASSGSLGSSGTKRSNPYSESSAMPGSNAGGSATFNPYSPSASLQTPVTSNPAGIYPVGIDTIFDASIKLFKSRLGLMIGIGAIVFGLSIVLQVVQQVVQAVAGAMDPVAGLILVILVTIFGVLAGMYVSLGTISAILAVARDEVSPLGKLIISPIPVLKFMAGILLIGLPILALCFIPFLILPMDSAKLVALIISVVSCLIFVFVLIPVFWAWPILLADHHPGIIAPMRTSLQITRANPLTSILIFLVNMIVPMVGLLMCCVGSLATHPFKITVCCVAYLMMTGQWASIQNAYQSYAPYPNNTPSAQ